MVHVARTTPGPDVKDALAEFDVEVIKCLESSCMVQLGSQEAAIKQARLSIGRGGLGLRAVSDHCSAAFIASHLRALPEAETSELEDAVKHYNKRAAANLDASVLVKMKELPTQKSLSAALEQHLFTTLVEEASPADKARLLGVSTRHASGWLRAVPSRIPYDNTLENREVMASVTHRLGLPLPSGGPCGQSNCVKTLDPLGHHAVTCAHGPYRMGRHNSLRNRWAKICSTAGIANQKEQGCSGSDSTRPADLLLTDFPGKSGKPLALDFTVVSPLTNTFLGAGGVNAEGMTAVQAAETKKHRENDAKCRELSWECLPMVVSTYGEWGEEAAGHLSRVGQFLADATATKPYMVIPGLYNALSVVLVKHNARAILSRHWRGSVGRCEVLRDYLVR